MKPTLKAYNWTILAFILSSCALHPKSIQQPALFPDGQYTQSVQLDLKIPNQSQQMIPFTSLSKIDKGHFKILGLTPFGSKAFQAHGKIEKPSRTQVEFFVPLPPSLDPQFVKDTLFEIAKIHKIKRTDLRSKGTYDEFRDKNLTLKIYKYRQDGIPASFTLSERHWKAFVNTSSYKPLSGSEVARKE